MAAGGGKEIGRLTIRVLPDTDGFRSRLRAALAGLDDDINIGLDLDSDGLRSKVSSAVKAAERGQTIHVDTKVDDAHIERLARRMDRLREQKVDIIPGDKLTPFLNDVKKLLASDDFTIKTEPFDRLASDMKRLERLKNIEFKHVDDDMFRNLANDFRNLMESKNFELSFDKSKFAGDLQGVVSSIKPKITPEIDPSLQRAVQNVLDLDGLNVRPKIDTSEFSRQAMEARQIAERVLERGALQAKLDADDRALNRKIKEAKIALDDLANGRAAPEINVKKIAAAEAAIVKLEAQLDALDKKRSDPTVDLRVEKFNIKRAQLIREIDSLRDELGKADTGKVEELEYRIVDKQNSIKQVSASIEKLKNERIELDANISRVRDKIRVIRGEMDNIRDSNSDIDINVRIENALAELATLEAAKASLTSRREKIRMELDGGAVKKAMDVLSRDVSEFAESAGRILTNRVGDAFGKMTDDADELRQSLARLSKIPAPKIRPELDKDAGDKLFKALNDALRRSDAIEVPLSLDLPSFSKKAQSARNIARKVLEAAELRVKMDADDAELTLKLAEARAKLDDLSRMRVNPEIVTRGVERSLAEANALERELEILDRFRADPEIRLRADGVREQIVSLRREAEEMSRQGYTPEFDADIQRAQISIRRLENDARKATDKRRELDFKLGGALGDGGSSAIGKAMDVLTETTSKGAEAAGKLLTSTVGDAFGSISTQIGGATTRMGGFLGSIGRVAGPIGLVATAVVGILVGLFAVAAIGTAVALIGAAIAAAFATVVTAIAAAIPVAAGLGLAFAVVKIGMEGIKRAASTLKPEFDKLKTAVENTFEKGMRPAFERLRPVMATLQRGAVGIAEGINTVADSVSKMIVELDKAGVLSKAFDNIKTSISGMAPGIASIVSAIARMMSVSEGFEALTNTVNRFGAAWEKNVKEMIADGSLQASFSGLESVLAGVSDALVSMVTNGLRMFASAAPGIRTALDGITNFFNRFDYDRLGTAVGRVFEGIGRVFSNIPDGTIERVTQSFERLGEAFNSPAFQSGAQAVIDTIVMIIGALPGLVEGFGNLANFILGITQVIIGAFQLLGAGMRAAMALATGDMEGFLKEIPNIAEGKATIDAGFEALRNSIQTGGTKITAELRAQILAMGEIGATLGPALTNGLEPAAQAVDGAMARLAELTGTPPPTGLDKPWAATGNAIGLAPPTGINSGVGPTGSAAGALEGAAAPPGGSDLPGMWGQATEGTGAAVSGPLNEAATQAQSAAQSIQTTLSNGTALWSATINNGLTALNSSFTAAFTSMAQTATAAMNLVTQAILTGSLTWATSITMAVTLMATAFMVGFTTMAATAVAGMALITAAIVAGSVLWAVAITTAVTLMVTALTTGFALMAAAALAGMMVVTAAILAGTALWAAAITAGMALMAAAVITGFALIGAGVLAGMAVVTAAIIAGTAMWAAAITAGIALMVAAAGTGFAGLAAIAAAGMAATTAAIVAGTAAWGTAVTTGAVVMTGAVTAAMAVIVSTITSGMAQATAAVTSGAAQMTAAFVNAFAQITAAASSGMAAFVSAVQSGVAAGVAACNAAVGQFRAAGVNMGAALAAGLESQVGRVQAAAARLANAAAAATAAAAQIRSPSRVFIGLGGYIGEGFAVGIDNGRKQVRVSARRLVAVAVGVAQSINDRFGAELGIEEHFNNLPSSIRSYASGDFSGSIGDIEMGSVEDRIESALAQWDIQFDANGVGRMVNKYNARKARRK